MELIPGLPDDIAVQCLIRVSYKDFPSISSVCRRWKALLDLPHFSHFRKRFSQRVIVMALSRFVHNVHVLRIILFEPQSGKWTEVPKLPSTMFSYPRSLPNLCKLVSVGYNFVIMGGKHPDTFKATRWVFIYNFISRSWRRGKNMPGRPRFSFACASDNNRTVFVAGGEDDNKNALKSALSYDVVNDEWTPLPDMAQAGNDCKGIFRQGKFHVICGCHTQEQVFDVKKWGWDEVGEDFKELKTCLRFCVIGGNGKIYRFDSGKVLMLGEGEDKFQMIATLPTKLLVLQYMIEWDGNLLVMVSEWNNSGPSQAYVLDLKSGSWKQVQKPIEYYGYVNSHCCLDI